MATKLFLRTSTQNGIAGFSDMLTTAGDVGTDTAVVNTAASGTEIQWTHTAGGAVAEWISGRSPVGGFSLAGIMTFSIWAQESNMNANCGARAKVYKRTSAGVETLVGTGSDGVEFGTSAAEMVWTLDVATVAFAEDDRIVVRFYITNIGTMASGHTCTLTYSGPDATTGDSFFQITENVTFKADATTHAATGALTGQIGSVTGSATRFRAHAATGTLAGQGSTVAGSAARAGPPVSHDATGAIEGPGSILAASAARTRQHAASGALTGAGAILAGSSARFRAHAASGALAGPGAVVIGSAMRDVVAAGAIIAAGLRITLGLGRL